MQKPTKTTVSSLLRHFRSPMSAANLILPASYGGACGARNEGPLRPKGLILRGCLERKGDERGASAVSRYREVVRDLNVRLGICADREVIGGLDKLRDGRPVGFRNGPIAKKLTVAVDVDEVLGDFISALNKFIADRYNSKHSVSDYHVYEFFKVWNCSRAEADIRVHEFFKTPYFKKGIRPIPGARRVLDKISPLCNLSVVTSRQNIIKDHTLEWIENYYPGLFQETHFGNHFALDGQSRSKSEICRSFGAEVLIDDNPRYAVECAEVGMKVLLFDYDNSYPWSKSGSATLHPLVTKVHNWDEVEQNILSWIAT